MRAASEAMGLPTKDLIKLVETGQLMAEDFMIPFANAVRRIVRESGALEAAQQKVISNQGRLITIGGRDFSGRCRRTT